MVQDCSTPAAQLAPMIEDLSSPIGGIANSASTESPIPVVYSAHTLPHPPVDCATGTPLLASRQGAPAAKPAPRVVPTNRPLHLTEVKTEKAAKPSSKKHELSKGRAAPGSAKDTRAIRQASVKHSPDSVPPWPASKRRSCMLNKAAQQQTSWWR